VVDPFTFSLWIYVFAVALCVSLLAWDISRILRNRGTPPKGGDLNDSVVPPQESRELHRPVLVATPLDRIAIDAMVLSLDRLTRDARAQGKYIRLAKLLQMRKDLIDLDISLGSRIP